jgi:dihydroflavonol-4-reductase
VPDFLVRVILVRVIAIFDPVARGRLYKLGKPRQVVSSEKARRMLGWTTRPVPETVLDTAKSLQAQGLVWVGP